LQAFFERVRVRLVNLEVEVGLVDPAPRIVNTKLGIARGHLLDSDDDLHER
jgi:hypothetical protein